jgi:Protein of unknown function (DUF3078)
MKTTSHILLAICLTISANLFAQEVKKDTSYWVKKTQVGANLNQASFSNWAGGGQASKGLNLFFNTKGDYAKEKMLWTNDLQMQFGVLDNGSGARKSIDRLFFDSKVGYKISKTWNLFGNINFQSQFTPTYNYDKSGIRTDKVSNLFAPAFITESIGLEWKPKPYFSMQFAPGAVRQTIVSDDEVKFTKEKPNQRYGVAEGKSIRNEIAIMQLVANFDKDIAKNVNMKLRYQMFASVDDLAAIDNRLDAKFAAKINKYLSATFDLILLYDQDQSFQIQTAQTTGIGLLYTF